jgi:oxygen-independent coproporphyrinogen-3 oxidase
LVREIELFDGQHAAGSVFFGGGTPTLLSEPAFERIFDALHKRFEFDSSSIEISIEANPDDVTPERARFWRDLGVNRLSLGVQAFDDDVLRFLGRCHDAPIARRACEIVASEFDTWGIDLIFGAKPPDRWNASVAECVRLTPTHVSTYALTYEERTPFWNQRAEAVDDDTALDQYRYAMDALGAEGYDHYEVSNFARPGFESSHNLIYWRNEDYAGFGPGAVGYLNGVRVRNMSRIAAYLARPGEKEESIRLSEREKKVETLIQHFRTRAGIRRDAYRSRFGTGIDDDFGAAIGALVQRGLLEDTGDRALPTRLGYELNNEIGLALV